MDILQKRPYLKCDGSEGFETSARHVLPPAINRCASVGLTGAETRLPYDMASDGATCGRRPARRSLTVPASDYRHVRDSRKPTRQPHVPAG